nr:sulfotransferase family 2 domain-containing protein [uncultured Carboxylicivirga sp.]
MISHKYKCIFIHLPKTGGESITSFFDDNDRNIAKHANALQIREYVGEKIWNEYFKFTIVRNPYEQAVSMYSHLRKPLYQKNEIYKKYGKTILNPILACKVALRKNFPSYCKKIYKRDYKYIEKDRQWNINYFSPYLDWITDSDGNIIIDYIGRFENLTEEINHIFKVINKDHQTIPVHNKSNHTHYSTYYNQDARKIINQHYNKDIKYFSYTFDDQSHGKKENSFFNKFYKLFNKQ